MMQYLKVLELGEPNGLRVIPTFRNIPIPKQGWIIFRGKILDFPS